MTQQEDLTKKLGIWGKDKILREDKKFHASDYYCVGCYYNKKQKKLVPAKAFWPCMDIDIRDHPYCQGCIDRLNIEILGKRKFW